MTDPQKVPSKEPSELVKKMGCRELVSLDTPFFWHCWERLEGWEKPLHRMISFADVRPYLRYRCPIGQVAAFNL